MTLSVGIGLTKQIGSRGSVLVTVLAMLAVLLTVLLAAMTYGISRHSVHRAALNRLHAYYLAESGISRMANSPPGLAIPDADSIDFPNGGRCTIRCQTWGPHYLVEAVGIYGGQAVVRRALLGSAGHEGLDAAIVVGDETLPLVATGAVRIRGTIAVGPPGFTEGRIDGQGLVYEDYHRGGLQVSLTTDLPVVDTVILQRYLDELHERAGNPDKILTGSQALRDLSAFNAIADVIEIENDLVLEDVQWRATERLRTLAVGGTLEFTGQCRMSGFCEITASRVVVGGQSTVDNVVLFATDSLWIGDSASFSGIAISSGAIVVADSARLLYPSELVAFDLDEMDRRPVAISLTSRVALETAVVNLGRPTHSGDGALVYVDTLTTVAGYILCENQIDLRGRVLGSVMTEQFRYESPPTTYVNWLKDCVVDRTQLSHAPLLPALRNCDSTITVGIIRED